MALFLDGIPMDLDAPIADVRGLGFVQTVRIVDPYLIPKPWHYRIIYPLMVGQVPLDVCFHGVYDGSSREVNHMLEAARSVCWYPEWTLDLTSLTSTISYTSD